MEMLFNLKRLQNFPFLFLILASLITAFALWGVPSVPFHPDESTGLYMSRDLESLFSHPDQLTWSPDKEGDLRQRYRKLDAPITRYLLGVGRLVARLPALPADWDWSKDWKANQAAGALPSDALLLAGRYTVTLLFPFTLYFLYRVGKSINGELCGLAAVLFLGLNALTLLHARRAMAEGALLFGISFSLYGIIEGYRKPGTASLGVAFAFNAKQSAMGLFPMSFLATVVPNQAFSWRKSARNILVFSAIFLVVTLALNPFLWKHPWQAAMSAWQGRQQFVASQVEATTQFAPQQVLSSPLQRGLVLIANLYLTPPSFYEVGNYIQETEAAESHYLSIPGHNLLRGISGAAGMLSLGLFGIYQALRNLRNGAPENRRLIALLFLAGLFQTAALLIAVPLPYQRYSLPLLPFACLWAAYGVSHLAAGFARLSRRLDQPSHSNHTISS